MDEFKNWLDKNEEAKNFYNTDLDSIWEGIDADLNKTKTLKPFHKRMWVRVAASLLLIATVGAFLFKPEAAPEAGFALGDVSEELAETEFFYASQLDEKLEIIKASGADVDQELFTHLDELDGIYKELMKDLKDGADNEEVVEAMIQNYRIRLQMLEQILSEIQDTDTNEEDEITI